MRQLRARQAAPADAEEDALSREFAGSVTLTFREDRSIVLTPAQARAQACLRQLCRCFSCSVSSQQSKLLLFRLEQGTGLEVVVLRKEGASQNAFQGGRSGILHDSDYFIWGLGVSNGSSLSRAAS